MQNTTQNFRQCSIVSRKPGILSKNLKPFTSSNYPTVQCFLLKLCSRFLLTNVYKRVSGIFFISFKSWVICKNLKRAGFYKLGFYHHRHSPGIFPEQSKSKSSYTQVVIKLPRKNVELFSAWKRYVRSLMHLRFWEILKHFQNGKSTLETL